MFSNKKTKWIDPEITNVTETITYNWNRMFSNVILLLTSKDYSPTFQNFELWIPQELLKS